MGEGKGSTLVHLLVIVLSLTAFGFAIAAERRRSTVSPLCVCVVAYTFEQELSWVCRSQWNVVISFFYCGFCNRCFVSWNCMLWCWLFCNLGFPVIGIMEQYRIILLGIASASCDVCDFVVSSYIYAVCLVCFSKGIVVVLWSCVCTWQIYLVIMFMVFGRDRSMKLHEYWFLLTCNFYYKIRELLAKLKLCDTGVI